MMIKSRLRDAHVATRFQAIVRASIAALAVTGMGADARADTLVQVQVESVVVGPARADGRKWDGDGMLSKQEREAFHEAVLAMGTYGGPKAAAISALIVFVSKLSMGKGEKPDTHGTAELSVTGTKMQRHVLAKFDHSLMPYWRDITWTDVPLEKDVRIRLELLDSDSPTKNELIGHVMLNADDLKLAYTAKRVVAIPALDQTSNQVVAVKLSVLPMPEPAPEPKQPPADDAPETSTDAAPAPDAVLNKIHRDYMPGIRRCYTNALKKLPKLQGKLGITMTVDETGRAVNGRASGLAPDVDRCVTDLMHTWRLPIPRDRNNNPTSASFAISFRMQPD